MIHATVRESASLSPGRSIRIRPVHHRQRTFTHTGATVYALTVTAIGVVLGAVVLPWLQEVIR